jgi:hypothetical protein
MLLILRNLALNRLEAGLKHLCSIQKKLPSPGLTKIELVLGSKAGAGGCG